jgi:uridine kinase
LQDWYYKDKSGIRQRMGEDRYWDWVNLDEPEALMMGRMQQDLAKLCAGKPVTAPGYDYRTSRRVEGQNPLLPKPFISFDGLFALHPVDYAKKGETLAEQANLGIFVATPMAELCRRWWQRAPIRNVQEDPAGIAHFVRVMDMYGRHILPSKRVAGLVLDGAAPIDSIREAFSPLAALLTKMATDKATDKSRVA